MEGRPLNEPGDEWLIDRARTGDGSAYGELVRRHQRAAFRVAFVLTGSASDAEDAAQTGFIKAYRALRRFRPGADFRPWLLTIVGNEARNAGRAARRRHNLDLRLAEVRPSDDAAPSSEEAVLARGDRTELVRALGQLAARDREVIACRYLLELSEAETAAALGCAPGTVKSRLSRALRRLEAEVRAGGGGPVSRDPDA